MTLTRMDDFPRHQVVETMAHVGVPNLSWNDGYWFSVWDPNGEIFLFTGMRVYQNADVMDGYACFTRRGKHVNARVSRRYSADYDDLRVGPLSYAIIEGMRKRRLRLDPQGHGAGFSFDIVWEAAEAPYEEARRTQRVGGIVSLDILRYWQAGRGSGSLRIGDEEFRISEREWCGGMDHSWGLRPIMGPKAPAELLPPVPSLPPGKDGLFRLAALFQMPEYTGFFHTHEDPSGRVEWFEGWLNVRGGKRVEIVKVEHAFRYHEGSRRFAKGRYVFTDATGKRWEHAVVPTHEPIEPRAIGYFPGFKDGKGTGVFRGDLVVENDTWTFEGNDLVDPSGNRYPRNGYLGPAQIQSDGAAGTAYFEHFVLGSYRRYGIVADAPVPVTIFV